jgi:hypothetical protein
MKEIKDGIVYSDDIELILKGYNNLDYNYKGIILPSNIEDLRKDFLETTKMIFSKVTIISEEDMISSMALAIRDVLGIYPHCFTR